MWIVKLGGSLSRNPHLLPWLRMLAEFGGGRVTIVPGGAAFADTVRQAQVHWGFDDLAAHNMAVLAMVQTAQMLHALEPRLELATQEADIRNTLHAGRLALWQPYSALRDAPDADFASWEVSSDSLALWLARRMNAERLVLVKSCVIDPQHSLHQMCEAGVLDARFSAWAQDAAFPIEVLNSQDLARCRDALLGGALTEPAVHHIGRVPPPRARRPIPATRRPRGGRAS